MVLSALRLQTSATPPTTAQLAKLCEVSQQYVSRILRRLEDQGRITYAAGSARRCRPMLLEKRG